MLMPDSNFRFPVGSHLVTAGINDNDVSRHRALQRFVNHQIIAGTTLHCESRPCHRGSVMHWPQRSTGRRESRHYVANVSHRYRPELLCQFRTHTALSVFDLKTNHFSSSNFSF
jgi:hypothetical protein